MACFRLDWNKSFFIAVFPVGIVGGFKELRNMETGSLDPTLS